MNNSSYLKSIVKSELNKFQQDKYIQRLILEEYQKIQLEQASAIKTAINKGSIKYTIKNNELDNGGPIQPWATKLFIEFFNFLKEQAPEVRIEITGGNDSFHKKYLSRHVFGEAIDFVVKDRDHVAKVIKVCKEFKKKYSKDFHYLDEYTHQTEHATGDHIHIAYKGADSLYNKARKNNMLPKVIPGKYKLMYPAQIKSKGVGYNMDPKDQDSYNPDQDTYGDNVFTGDRISVKDFNSINKWQGTKNGVDLEKLDSLLLYWAEETGGAPKGGSSIKMMTMGVTVQGTEDEDQSHKWVIKGLIKVPKPKSDAPKFSDAATKGVYGNLEPDEDGMVPTEPETFTFYPSGNCYLYNQKLNSDPQIENRFTALEKIYNYFAESTGEKIDKATIVEQGMAGGMAGNTMSAVRLTPAPKKTPDALYKNLCIQLLNASGDLLGTLYLEKGKIIFDLTGAAQYTVDDNYEATGSEKFFNQLQFVLDLIGFVPIIGDIVDIINAIIYFMRDRYLEAVLSIIAVIPVVGSAIKFSVKGAMKGAEAAAKSAKYGLKSALNKKGIHLISNKMAKNMFTRGQKGERAAEYLIETLINSGLVTKKELTTMNLEALRKVFSSKSKKTKDVFMKYFPGSASMKRNITDFLKDFDAFGDNFAVALKKYNDEGAEALAKLDTFGPKGMIGKAALDATDSAAKTWLNKTLSKAGNIWKKVGLFRNTKNILTRIPARRADLVKDWMLRDVTDRLMKDPKKLRSFLASIGKEGKGLALKGKSNQYIAKLKPGQKAELIKRVMSDKGVKTAAVREMMAKPGVYFSAQLRYGVMGTLQDLAKGDITSMKKLMMSAIGPKQFDVAYNEIKEVLWREAGIDVGGYGDEQESLVAALLFKMFCNEEAQKARRNRRISHRGQIGMMANALRFIGANDPAGYLSRDQIQDVGFNSLPGDSVRDRMEWVKTHGDAKDYELIKNKIGDPLDAADELEKK